MTGRAQPLRVGALMMVRNEADVVATNIRYHAAAGITDFFIIDNGSIDATPDLLATLADELPGIRWTRNDGAFQQALLTTGLARDAFEAGVDWVVPIDADEFWHVRNGSFADALAATDAVALEVQLHTFVQKRDVLEPGPDVLSTMTYRIDVPHPYEGARAAIESGEVAFVEMTYPPKWVTRSAPQLTIAPGNHTVVGIEGERAAAQDIVCFHAPLRARSVLHAKAEQGRRWREIGSVPEAAWHLKRWADLEDAGQLHDDWAANSWRAVDGTAIIDSGRGPVRVVADTRLRDLVSPYGAAPTTRRRRWGSLRRR